MKKKVEKLKNVKTTGTPIVEEVCMCEQINTLSEDFGRGDLNLMRDKLNEVINKVNQCQ